MQTPGGTITTGAIIVFLPAILQKVLNQQKSNIYLESDWKQTQTVSHAEKYLRGFQLTSSYLRSCKRLALLAPINIVHLLVHLCLRNLGEFYGRNNFIVTKSLNLLRLSTQQKSSQIHHFQGTFFRLYLWDRFSCIEVLLESKKTCAPHSCL